MPPPLPAKRICSIPGCGKKYLGLGYCSMHHKRFKLHGDPLLGGRTGRLTDEEIRQIRAEFARVKRHSPTNGIGALARRRGLHRTSVVKIGERLSYKWVR